MTDANGVRPKTAALLTRTSRPPSAAAACAHETARRNRRGEIGAETHGPNAERREVLARLTRGRCRSMVADGDVHARAREGQGDGAAHAHGAAGDERPRPFLDCPGPL